MALSLVEFLVVIVVNIVKSVVYVYTFFIIPIYYLLEKPWKTLKMAGMCGANFIKRGRFIRQNGIPESLSNAEYLEFEHDVPIPHHPLMKCNTITEAIYARSELYPNDLPSIGYRQILEEEIQHDQSGNPIKIDGKVLRKYKLSDYKWVTYGDFLEQVEAINRGLYAVGFKKHDPIAIYSETGFDFMISMIASGKAGALIVTVFHTLTDQGLIHALNQTKVKIIFVSFELVDRVHGFVKNCPHLKTIIYYEGKFCSSIHTLLVVHFNL